MQWHPQHPQGRHPWPPSLYLKVHTYVQSRVAFSDAELQCTATSQQQMALNFELFVSDQLFSVVLASCKWFKISAPGVGMRHMWQLDTLHLIIPTWFLYEFLVALMDAIITLGKFNFHQNSLGWELNKPCNISKLTNDIFKRVIMVLKYLNHQHIIQCRSLSWYQNYQIKSTQCPKMNLNTKS